MHNREERVGGPSKHKLQQAAGQVSSFEAPVPVELGPLEKDPTEVMSMIASQKRAEIVGSLLAAYTKMTGLDPTEVELVQRQRENGSIGYRFRPREELPVVWVICLSTASSEGVLSTSPVRTLPGTILEEAVEEYINAIEPTVKEQTGEFFSSLFAVQVPFAGFPEDLQRGESDGEEIGTTGSE